MNTKEKILEILQELGNVIDLNSNDDIDLTEYILDSLQFMSFILSVEEKFEIEFPDEMLQMENIKSINSFSEIIDFCINKNNENQ